MIASLVLAQVVLPLALIGWLAIAPPPSLIGISVQALATAIGLFALSRMGLWLFPPWWTPYVYGLLFVLALVVGLRQYKLHHRLMPSRFVGWAMVVGFTAFGVFAANEAARSVAGQFQPPIPAVDLAFALRGGDYLIINGGNDIRINAHLKTMDTSIPRFRAYRGNGYALDIVKLDRFGFRAQGVVPQDPAAYHIYGQPVLAPCAGEIISTTDGLPDMTIPKIDRTNLAGNHVILRCGDIDVALAHFRPNSLLVHSGMQVNVGDQLAEVGNSGASDEPHLHIHAQRPGSSVAPMSGDPLPINFDGRFLIRNDRISMPINKIGDG